jgi:hypothetical protein
MLAAVSDNNVYAVFGGDKTGTWHANGGWNQLTSAVPVAMDASPDGTMYASYSDGTYEYAGWSNLFFSGWTKITSQVATQIAALNNLDFVGSFADGTDEYDNLGNHFTFTPDAASHLGHSGSTIIAALTSGTWTIPDADSIGIMHQIDDTESAYMFG